MFHSYVKLPGGIPKHPPLQRKRPHAKRCQAPPRSYPSAWPWQNVQKNGVSGHGYIMIHTDTYGGFLSHEGTQKSLPSWTVYLMENPNLTWMI